LAPIEFEPTKTAIKAMKFQQIHPIQFSNQRIGREEKSFSGAYKEGDDRSYFPPTK